MMRDDRGRPYRRILVPALVLFTGAVVATAVEARSEMEEIQITVGDLVFDAVADGPEDGELIFLLHGFPQTSYEYRHQIPVLAAMGYRVVAPDQRGYSPGARPEPVGSYVIPKLVEDVVGMADALGRERFHVVGHDWGAAVAWFTGLNHPERVISLVAISVPHPFAFSEALQSPSGQQAGMSGYMEIFSSDSSETLFLRDDAAMLRGIYEGAGLSDDEIDVYVDALGSEEALRAALNWYRAMALSTPAQRLTPISMPTMYVWSTDDMALGREGAELTEKYIEGPYRFEILEGVSHWVPEEAADQLNELLQEHFSAHGGG